MLWRLSFFDCENLFHQICLGCAFDTDGARIADVDLYGEGRLEGLGKAIGIADPKQPVELLRRHFGISDHDLPLVVAVELVGSLAQRGAV